MSAPASAELCPDFVIQALEVVQTISDLAGMAAAAVGLISGVVMWLMLEARLIGKKDSASERCAGIRTVRAWMGRYILLGLEFMIVSDVIHSFLSHDLVSLYKLGLIVVVRTAISFFLGKEIEADESGTSSGMA